MTFFQFNKVTFTAKGRQKWQRIVRESLGYYLSTSTKARIFELTQLHHAPQNILQPSPHLINFAQHLDLFPRFVIKHLDNLSPIPKLSWPSPLFHKPDYDVIYFKGFCEGGSFYHPSYIPVSFLFIIYTSLLDNLQPNFYKGKGNFNAITSFRKYASFSLMENAKAGFANSKSPTNLKIVINLKSD